MYVVNNDIQLYEESKLLAKTTFLGDIEVLNFKRILAAIDYIIKKDWKKSKSVNKGSDATWLTSFVSKDLIFQEICRRNYILKFNKLTINELILAMNLLGFKTEVFTSTENKKFKNAFFNLSLESIVEQPKQASLF